MADQTIVAKDSAYRSHVDRSENADRQRVSAVRASLELLHAAAIGGAYNSGHADKIGANMAEAVGPLADAIEAALKGSKSA